MSTRLRLMLVTAALVGSTMLAPVAQSVETTEFFPLAFGTAAARRAPRIEREARSKKETWRKDVKQIKALGFNTVRAAASG